MVHDIFVKVKLEVTRTSTVLNVFGSRQSSDCCSVRRQYRTSKHKFIFIRPHLFRPTYKNQSKSLYSPLIGAQGFRLSAAPSALWLACDQRTFSRLELGLAQLWAAQRNSPLLELRLACHPRLAEDQKKFRNFILCCSVFISFWARVMVVANAEWAYRMDGQTNS
ncbi:hypothetical protein JHK86_022533 [Glycine max]|nr:hypothetical protein JHK86_022533 [Glycine max]